MTYSKAYLVWLASSEQVSDVKNILWGHVPCILWFYGSWVEVLWRMDACLVVGRLSYSRMQVERTRLPAQEVGAAQEGIKREISKN